MNKADNKEENSNKVLFEFSQIVRKLMVPPGRLELPRPKDNRF